jgi:hypothetical protein
LLIVDGGTLDCGAEVAGVPKTDDERAGGAKGFPVDKGPVPEIGAAKGFTMGAVKGIVFDVPELV